jgi:hypothetical protein
MRQRNHDKSAILMIIQKQGTTRAIFFPYLSQGISQSRIRNTLGAITLLRWNASGLVFVAVDHQQPLFILTSSSG